jgi:hypothetical protein
MDMFLLSFEPGTAQFEELCVGVELLESNMNFTMRDYSFCTAQAVALRAWEILNASVTKAITVNPPQVRTVTVDVPFTYTAEDVAVANGFLN